MYRIFDLLFDSEITLPELPVVDGNNDGLRFKVFAGERDTPVAVSWHHEWLDDNNEVTIRSGNVHDGYVLQFPEFCEFWIDRQRRQIRYTCIDDIPDETIRHLLLDQVIPRMLGQGGKLVLHASAITIPDGDSIAFVGDSGWGKSTIASAFYEDGAKLLTDDCLLVAPEDGLVTGVPNYHGIRLFQDSVEGVFGGDVAADSPVAHYSEKKRMLVQAEGDRALAKPARLAAIFLLNNPAIEIVPESVSIAPINGGEEMMVIIKQMFVIDPTDTGLMAEQFMLVSKLIHSQIPIFRLSYPRHHSLLTDVMRSVKEAVANNRIDQSP